MTGEGIADEQNQKKSLVEMLQEMAQQHSFQLVAEEGTLDGSCIGAVVAGKLSIEYIDITMPIDERERCGIRTPDYDRDENSREAAYRLFERYMFERVKAQGVNTTLVMCGRRHLAGLVKRFEQNGDKVLTYDIFDSPWYRGRPIESSNGIIGYDRED